VQVSCNLVNPLVVGPAEIYDAVAQHAEIGRAELVGLIGRDVLARIDRARWAELDVGDDRTLEARLPIEPRPGPGGSSGDLLRSGARGGRSAAGQGARPAHAATLTLTHAAPDTELLAVGQRELKALLAHDAALADLFGLTSRRAALRKEQIGIDAHAVGVLLPTPVVAF
jgi:hypothetical protein